MSNYFGQYSREDIIQRADTLREERAQRQEFEHEYADFRASEQRADEFEMDRNIAHRIMNRGAEALYGVYESWQERDIDSVEIDISEESHSRFVDTPGLKGRGNRRFEIEEETIDRINLREFDPIHQVETQVRDFGDRIMQAASGFDITSIVPETDDLKDFGRRVITPSRETTMSWEERIEEHFTEEPSAAADIAVSLQDTLVDVGESIPEWIMRASSRATSSYTGVPIEDVTELSGYEEIADYESVTADIVGETVGFLGQMAIVKSGIGAAGAGLGKVAPQITEAFRSLPSLVQAGAEWGSYLMGRDIFEDQVWESARRDEYDEIIQEHQTLKQLASMGLVDESEIPSEEELPSFREFAGMTLPDYVQSFGRGFAAGAAGELVAPVIREMAVREYIPDSIYPLTQGFGTGAARGVAYTGVDKLFHPDDTTAKDLGLNMIMLGSLGVLGTAGKWDEMRSTVDYINKVYKASGVSKYPENMQELNKIKQDAENFKDQLWNIGRNALYYENLINEQKINMYKDKPRMNETDPYGDRPINFEDMKVFRKYTDLTDGQREFLMDQITANYMGYQSAIKHLEQLSIPMGMKDGLFKKINDIFENTVSDSFTSVGMDNMTFDAITGDLKPAKPVTQRPGLVKGVELIEDVAKIDTTPDAKMALQKLTAYGKSKNDNIVDYNNRIGGFERVKSILDTVGTQNLDNQTFGEILSSETPLQTAKELGVWEGEPIELGPVRADDVQSVKASKTIDSDDIEFMSRSEIVTELGEYKPSKSFTPDKYAKTAVSELSDEEVYKLGVATGIFPENYINNYDKFRDSRREMLIEELKFEVDPEFAKFAIEEYGIEEGKTISNLKGYPKMEVVSVSEKYTGHVKLKYPDGMTEDIDIQTIAEKTMDTTEALDSTPYGNVRQISFDEVPEQTKEGLGYRAGEIRKSESLFNQATSFRGTGHFGTGVYFFGNKQSRGFEGYVEKGRPVHEIDISDYNLYKPDTETEAKQLHKFLKHINQYISDPEGKEDYLSKIMTTSRLGLLDIFKDIDMDNEEFMENFINDFLELKETTDRSDWRDMDSASTALMKELGYEGVDVTHLPGLDTSRYGSVIYNLEKSVPTSDELSKAEKEAMDFGREPFATEEIHELELELAKSAKELEDKLSRSIEKVKQGEMPESYIYDEVNKVERIARQLTEEYEEYYEEQKLDLDFFPPDMKYSSFVDYAKDIQKILERIDKGQYHKDYNFDEIDIITARQYVDDLGKDSVRAKKKAMKEIDRVIKNATDVYVEAKAEDVLREIEAKGTSSKKTRFQYEFVKLMKGDYTAEESTEKLSVIQSQLRDTYGTADERYDMIYQMFEEAAKGQPKVNISTPKGTMEITNDPVVLSKIARELGAKLKHSELDEMKPDVEQVKPTIPEDLARENYYVQQGENFIESLSAKPFAIEGLEHLDLFRYKPSKEPYDINSGILNATDWHIVEAETGTNLVTGKTIADAAKNLKDLLDEKGAAKIEKVIEKAKTEKGLVAPRYDENVEPTTPQIDYKLKDTNKSLYDNDTNPETQKFLYRLSSKDNSGFDDERFFHSIGDVQPYNRPVSKQEIEEIVTIDFGIPLLIDEMINSKEAGSYDLSKEVVRIRDYGDMEVLGHEMGHHISKTLNLEVGKYPSLINILEDEGLKNYYPEELWSIEGGAEFFKLYFNFPAEAARKAPKFSAHLQEKLEANPEFHKKVDKLQKAIITWHSQGGVERTRHSISKRDTMRKKYSKLKDLVNYYAFADDAKLQAVLREAAGIDWTEIEAAENPVKLYRLFNKVDDKVLSFLNKRQLSPEHDPRESRGGGPPLKDILANVADDIEMPTLWDEIKMKMPFLETPEIGIGDFTTWAVAKHALEREAKWIANNVVESTELKEEIINAVEKGDKEDYLATIIKEFSPKIGQATGLRPDDILETIKELEKPEFVETANQLQNYFNNLIDYSAKRGVFSQEQADNIKNAYNWYMPMHRVFGESDDIFPSGSFNKFANLPESVKSAYGSQRTIDDPIKNIIRNTQYMIRNADANQVGLSLINLIDEYEGLGNLAYKLKDRQQVREVALKQIQDSLIDAGLEPEDLDALDLDVLATLFEGRDFLTKKEQRENVVLIRNNGNLEAWKMQPELYEFMENINPELAVATGKIMRNMLKVLKTPASLFAKGAVYNPAYSLIINPLRDEIRELVYQNSQMADKFKFFQSTLEGIIGISGLDKDEFEALVLGTGVTRGSFLGLLGSDDPRSIKALLSDKLNKNPVDWLATMTKFTQETRYKGFFAEKLKDIDNLYDLEPEEFYRKTLEAGYDASSEIMEDYSVKGKLGRHADKAFVFASSGLTSLRHMYKKFQDPMTWLKAIAFIQIPAILNWFRNKDRPEYQELSVHDKIYFWNIFTDDGQRYAPPKPFAPGFIFGGLTELTLDAIYQQEPELILEGLKTTFNLGMPNYEMPHLISYIEIMTNRRWDRGTDIVPMGEQMLEPQYQYSHYTSETAKYLGSKLNMSPYKIDHAIRGQFSRLGQNVLDTGEFAAGAQGFQETLASILGVYREPFQTPVSVDKIYQARNEAQSVYRTFDEEESRNIPEDEMTYTWQEADAAEELFRELNDITRTFSYINQLNSEAQKLDIDSRVKNDVASYLNMLQVDIAREYRGKSGLYVEDYFTEEELDTIHLVLQNLD